MATPVARIPVSMASFVPMGAVLPAVVMAIIPVILAAVIGTAAVIGSPLTVPTWCWLVIVIRRNHDADPGRDAQNKAEIDVRASGGTGSNSHSCGQCCQTRPFQNRFQPFVQSHDGLLTIKLERTMANTNGLIH